ncbi:hypothetical protein ARMGADRAFT_1040813 [Armillaria gallica]|uniref:Uncharacterized protein n=1 Tax=Armillaria gallica TaxID=47427 RepID=A0A2H3C8N4_ARMGA|nr:hypothetical protein ARMGADRAFT_1040813 [Armillaria gallica]
MNLIDQPTTPNTAKIMMMWVTVIRPNLSVRYGWNVPYNVDSTLTDHIELYNREYDRRTDDIHATSSQTLGNEALGVLEAYLVGAGVKAVFLRVLAKRVTLAIAMPTGVCVVRWVFGNSLYRSYPREMTQLARASHCMLISGHIIGSIIPDNVASVQNIRGLHAPRAARNAFQSFGC